MLDRIAVSALVQVDALQKELADYKQKYKSTKADFEQVRFCPRLLLRLVSALD